MFCKKCGKEIKDDSIFCEFCGEQIATGGEKVKVENIVGQKNYLVAALLAIFIGYLGIHNFYLGYKDKAIAQLLLTCVGWIALGLGPIVASVWALVEGIQILTGSISEDADGVPLSK